MGGLWALAAVWAVQALPPFDYASTEQALKAWQARGAALPVRVEEAAGRKWLVLTAVFERAGEGATWDWHGRLDLSGAGAVSFVMRCSGAHRVSTAGFYFRAPGGWYAAFFRPAQSAEQIFYRRLSDFRREGSPAGLDKVDGVRVNVWSNGPGRVVLRLAELRATAPDPAENFLINGSFEIVSGGLPYGWSSGHWGVGHMPWAVNMDLWRRHWRLDTSQALHGQRSLCIDNSTGLPLLRAVSIWVTPPAGVKAVDGSAWVKADREAVEVVLQVKGRSRTFKVGREWTRLVVTGVPRQSRMYVAIVPRQPAKIWIDAVQLQAAGHSTAEFHPHPLDASIARREAAVDWSHPRRTRAVAAGRRIRGPVRRAKVSIDEHGRFLLNGRPYMHHSLGLEFVSDLRIIDFIARSGFKSICIHFRPPLDLKKMRAVFDRCAAAGLRLIPWLNQRFSDEEFAQIITALKDHPAPICWYVYDEPFGPERYAQAEARLKLAKRLDPSKPAFINYLSRDLEDQKGDIFSTDIYPIPHSGVMAAINGAAKMAAAARAQRKPAWIWLQGTGFAYWMAREPTPRELSCMVYGCLIEGVRGFYYFAQIPRVKALFDEMRALCVELDALEPVVFSLETPPEVSCRAGEIMHAAYAYKGRAYVVAVNTSPEKVRATFKVKAAGAARRAEVMFEGRWVPVHGGRWRDDFGPYERHVYVLRLSGSR